MPADMLPWALQTLDLDDNEPESASDYSGVGDAHFYEVTIGSVDQPKLLSRLTDALVRLRAKARQEIPGCLPAVALALAEHVLRMLHVLQGDLDLNICEAHAFTTSDKFSLDVFVVNGWQGEVSWAGTTK